eukprot:TRINITY_DN1212_c0_g1_i1.p1 TRINITY_DN1212_c0_g1~~TRINITY_DN1212_c0_g1_i1.p1  ORF type:complete len:217 (-),score=36.82 TRINITY_DN1212_c0_g1_i1:155-805(-)
MSLSKPFKPLVVLDFDQTLTAQDTTRLLALASQVSKLEKWEAHERLFHQNWKNFFNAALETSKNKKETLATFLTSLDRYEKEDLLKTQETLSEFLKGLDKKAIESASQNVLFNHGALETMRELKPKTRLAILSVNWSKTLVSASLCRFDPSLVQDVPIFCNELEFKDGVSTGYVRGDIHTAIDKLKCFREIKSEIDHSVSIYVGDSVTDLLALLLF